MYERYEIENCRCEDIINTFKLKKIYIKNLNILENKISFISKLEEHNKIINILEKYRVHILNIEKLTSSKIIDFIKERVFLILMILFMMPCLYYNLSFLKNIEITGNKDISLDSIYVSLRENDVRVGMKLNDLNTGYLENKFYIKYNNLKFITFNVVGTNLYIEIIDYEVKNNS